MELLGPKIKKFLAFFQKKAFVIFQEMELSSPKNFPSSKNKKELTPKKFLIFPEMELSSHKLKELLYL